MIVIRKCKKCGKEFKFSDVPSNEKAHRKGDCCSRSCASKYMMTDKLRKRISKTNKKNYQENKFPQCFKKGYTPWCKDKKGIHLSPETEFKKGHKQYLFHHSSETIAKMKKRRRSKKSLDKMVATLKEKNKDRIYKTDESKIMRRRRVYMIWRKLVYEKDDWTCQKCNIKGEILNPHHIQNFATHKKLRFEVNNGITFCVKCHKKFHKIYGIKINNYLQIKKFLSNEYDFLKNSPAGA